MTAPAPDTKGASAPSPPPRQEALSLAHYVAITAVVVASLSPFLAKTVFLSLGLLALATAGALRLTQLRSLRSAAVGSYVAAAGALCLFGLAVAQLASSAPGKISTPKTTTRPVLAPGGLASAVQHSGAIGGYAPAARRTFQWKRPAPYVTFDSITDNPYYGDERGFFDGYRAGSGAHAAQDILGVRDGETLTLRVFYDNDEAPNLGVVATGARVRILLPLKPGTRTVAAAALEVGNAIPAVVSDTVTLVGSRPFTVTYVPHSARIWNGALDPGQLSDAVIARGTRLGYRSLNGLLPPNGNAASGWVTINVKVYMEAS